jgi:hypothetical protein
VETGGESRAIGFIVENMKQRIGTGTRRDAHPKHHGLVRAALEIDANIPPDLRWGIFAAPRTYGAYVRFSNGRPGPDLADNVPDVRGCAIKLLGVEGLKMADDERLTHDFVLASHPVFFVRDVTEYVRFLQTPSSLLPAQFPELMKSFRIFGSPLTIRYFSQTPYALGPHCVKYKLEPIDPAPRDPIDPTAPGLGQKDPNFLRQALAEFLGKSPATFGLCVQLADATQIEDATAAWTSPFTQVATLTIRQQDFTSAPQDAFADAISMSPWHCLFDNRPLGSINRARLQIYQQASPLRHHNGGTSPREPDGINDF